MNRSINSIKLKVKNILLLTDGIWPYVIGGMQKHSYYLCKYFARNGLNVTLVHTADKIDNNVRDLDCFSEDEKKFISSIVVEKPKIFKHPGHYLTQAYLYSKAVYSAIKDLPPADFVIAKGLTSWHMLGRRERLKPIGINIHGYEYLQKQADAKSVLESLMFRFPLTYINRKADFVFSYGGKITDYIASLGISRDQIIESTAAIEGEWLAQQLPKLDHGRTLVFLGRYERRKGIQELNSVIEKISHRFKFDIHFIGPIPTDKKLTLPNVHYHGVVREKNELKRLLQQAQVLVCPSYSEGMPNVILEAMGNGCAVIATDVGAVSLLVNENTGWLIDVANAHALESAVEEVLTISADELERKRLNAFNKIRQDFLWENVSERLIVKMNAVLEKSNL